ncbi:Utp21 specific WD40 associated putative domain-containing protein [Delphinella strobiligena]|nr:Utp21 specific WD40 associated putative domain-containing protein [Delphinella strobiligena]
MPSATDMNGVSDGRVAKRQRVGTNEVAIATKRQRKIGTSRLFAPYRTVGLVSPTSVPFTSIPLGKTTFQLTTSVGRSLQTYDLRRGLNLNFITRPQTPDFITASLAWKDLVFAAWGGHDAQSARGVWTFKRGKMTAELEMPRALQENIDSICIFGSWIIGCCHSQILVWKSTNFELYTTLQGTTTSSFTGCVSSMPTMLNKIVAGKDDGTVELWNVSSGKLVYSILPPAADYGAVTALQPTPALSLLAIAYTAGPLIIQDVVADKTIMQFNSNLDGPSGPLITSISFRTDGMGAGDDGRKAGVMATASSQSGDVTLWDLNTGGRKAGVLRGAHAAPSTESSGGVSKAEFLPGQAILVTSGLDNSLKTWIFDETPFSPVPRILHQRSGHGAPVTTLAFLPAASDGSDASGKWLLSTSQDRSLWGWSLRRDGQSTELSQGNVTKKARKAGILASEGRDSIESLKAPPITAIACSLNRDGGIGAIPGKQPIWQTSGKAKVGTNTQSSTMTGWESVVTAHRGDNKARTWFWGRKKAGRWAFETGDQAAVNSVAMSPCGTFAVVGSANGGIDMFNLQSGNHRQRYPARLTPAQARQLKLDLLKADEEIAPAANIKNAKFYRGQGKHTDAVTGLAVDNLNRTVISCGADGRIKFWDFHTGLLKHEIDWSGAVRITGMRLHRGSELAAFSCHDGCIRVVDITTHKLIRELKMSRHASSVATPFADFAFSNDGRWILAATSSLVCAWDLPTDHLIDAFKLPSTCNAISFSPTGEYFATASSEHVGVDVWSNKTLFTHVPTRHITEAELSAIIAAESQAPTVSGEGGESLIGTLANAEEQNDEDDLDLDSPDLLETDLAKLSEDLVSLSLVPRSRWQNLLHLDVIRQRNKPIAPPKKPEQAPFFLPSLQERQNNPSLQRSGESQDLISLEQERSRIMRMDRKGNLGTFTNLLHNASETEDYSRFLSHLKILNPAAADVEIRSLSSATTSLSGDVDQANELVTFVNGLTSLLHSKRDFELGQAWMSVFLKMHADVVREDDNLRAAVAAWQGAARAEKARVEGLSEYCNGLVGYLRAARV